MLRLLVLALLASSAGAATDPPCSCQGVGCTCKPSNSTTVVQKDVSSISSAPRSSTVAPRGPAPRSGPAGAAEAGSGLTDATGSLASSLSTSQYSLPDSTTSNPILDLTDSAPALAPEPAPAEQMTATASPSPGPPPATNDATSTQYMVAGNLVVGNKTASEADLALINQDGFLFPNITDDGLLDSTVSELFTFNSTCSIGFMIVANSTMQVLLVNIITGTVEQRCDVIRTRACAVDTYDLDPDAAYSLYGVMTDTLDPIHYGFNMTFTACTRADAAIATGAAAKPSPTFQPSSLRSPSPARGASQTPSRTPQPAKPPAAAAASKTVYYPYMSYLDDIAISRRPYVALAVLGAREVTYSVAAVTVVDDYLVNVPLRGFLIALDDFDTWQNSTGSTDLLSSLAVAGGGCRTQRATGPCRGNARFSASSDAALSPAADLNSNSDPQSRSSEVYVLLIFNDGARLNKILAGRDSPDLARISVTYCIAAEGGSCGRPVA